MLNTYSSPSPAFFVSTSKGSVLFSVLYLTINGLLDLLDRFSCQKRRHKITPTTLAVIVINKPTITMATATYIGVLSSSLEVDPTTLLLCVGEGLGVQFKLPVTVTVTLSVVVCNMTVVTNSVVVSVTVKSATRPESVPPAVPLVILML